MGAVARQPPASPASPASPVSPASHHRQASRASPASLASPAVGLVELVTSRLMRRLWNEAQGGVAWITANAHLRPEEEAKSSSAAATGDQKQLLCYNFLYGIAEELYTWMKEEAYSF